MNSCEDGEQKSDTELDGSSPTTGKSLAQTLGSIEKTDLEVTSPVASHKQSMQTTNTSSDASPDDSPSEAPLGSVDFVLICL